jgi:hypothetical protein
LDFRLGLYAMARLYLCMVPQDSQGLTAILMPQDLPSSQRFHNDPHV